jgi:hypothetical protein
LTADIFALLAGYILTGLRYAEKYFELIKERKVKGYLGQEKNRFGGESA